MNKYLKEIKERYPLLFSDNNELKMIVSLLYNYCKELEDRLRVFEEAVPDSLRYLVSLPENDDTPQLEEDIEDTSLEPIRFGKEEAVEPTKLHQKARPANDWVMGLVHAYCTGLVTTAELQILHEKGELIAPELEFILNYNSHSSNENN